MEQLRREGLGLAMGNELVSLEPTFPKPDTADSEDGANNRAGAGCTGLLGPLVCSGDSGKASCRNWHLS